MAGLINPELENKLWKEVEKIVYRSSDDQSNLATSWKNEEEKTKFMYNLLSPLLTTYGMDKDTKQPKLLRDIDSSMESLDCCRILGKRSFLIDSDEANNLLNVYKGNDNYLENVVKDLNQAEKAIVPLEVNSHNHGFFQAVSVALVGKEIFWHPLQSHFFREMKNNADKYQRQKQLISKSIWESILSENDPDNIKTWSDTQPRLEMLFIMANVLRRPIILLDSEVKSGDSGIFLPVIWPHEQCCKSGLCLAWESKDRKKFIALAGVKGNCKLSLHQLPIVWGNMQGKLKEYLPPDDIGEVSIDGRQLSDKYFNDLIDCMKQLHMEKQGVGVNLVGDVYRCIFKPAGLIPAPAASVACVVKLAMEDDRIYKCLDCRYTGVVPRYLVPDGILYKQAIKQHGQVDFEKKYCFPYLGIQGKADPVTHNIVSSKSICRLLSCPMCHKKRMRKVTSDGDAVYFNGDVTPTGKYYWNGKEYDNKPKVIPIGLEWMGKVIPGNIEWFHNESDEASNSTFEGVVDILVNQHYPDETEPRLRERVKHIVRMRLEQQQDLDIPGIEKRKPQIIPPALLENLNKEPQGLNVGSSTGINVGSSGGASSKDTSTSSAHLDPDDDLYGSSGTELFGASSGALLDEDLVPPPQGFDDPEGEELLSAAGTRTTDSPSAFHTKNEYGFSGDKSPSASVHGSAEPPSIITHQDELIRPPQSNQTHSNTPNARESNVHLRIPYGNEKQLQLNAGDSESEDDLYPTSKVPELVPEVPRRAPSSTKAPSVTVTASPGSTSASPSNHQPSGVQVQGTNKKVKVVAKHGKQMLTVTLPHNVTYNQLQLILEKQTGIPSDKQDIRCGFPPKNIRPQNNQHLDLPLENISNGDRMILEELPD